MKNKAITFFLIIVLIACGEKNKYEKGFQVSEIVENEQGEKIVGLNIDSLQLETKPIGVILTKQKEHRLTPLFKVNYDKENKPFTGSIAYHTNWDYSNNDGNNWNNNYMPGFEAAYGYNLVNVSHFNTETKERKTFFEKPVLIKTVYYPAFSEDTLKNEAISRDYYMLSVYDEDSNKDGFINQKDFRKFYYIDINAENKQTLIPENYSVTGSEYDYDNDFMYIFTKFDENNNGFIEAKEGTSIFVLDLKNPTERELLYKSND